MNTFKNFLPTFLTGPTSSIIRFEDIPLHTSGGRGLKPVIAWQQGPTHFCLALFGIAKGGERGCLYGVR